MAKNTDLLIEQIRSRTARLQTRRHFFGNCSIGLDPETLTRIEPHELAFLGRDHHPDCFSVWMAGGGF